LDDWMIWGFRIVLRKNFKKVRRKLERRLVEFSVAIIKLSSRLRGTQVALDLAGQITRSATSAALNYGEAQGAESRRDFVHKVGIVLKELRETYINLQILSGSGFVPRDCNIHPLLDENNQLISIFHKTVLTAKSNLKILNPPKKS
jgi:four helix bundle protein